MGSNQLAIYMKRVTDIVGAGAIGTALLPALVGIAIAIRFGIGRPVLFRQVRPGWHTEPFTIYKFRTMTDELNASGDLRPDCERLTVFGTTLRRWSLDELPEFWNVLRGDMSLVGPRPLLVEYVDLYTDEQMRRHDMRPGLTGLAQISGRNDQTWEDRLALDVWYVDHWSLWLDAKILIMTVSRVLKGTGVAASGHATMPRFEGTAGLPGRIPRHRGMDSGQ